MTKKEEHKPARNTSPSDAGGRKKESSGEDMEKIKKQCDEYLDGWKRAKADLINYKKEEEERIQHIARFGQELFITDLIAVLHSFDLGFVSWKDDPPEKKGMMLIQSQLEDILKRHGLEIMRAEIGKESNPAESEVVEAVDSKETSGTVVEEVERGYKLHGKVIKPIKVKVAK